MSTADELPTFFRDVRFFTVVAPAKTFEVQIHRAYQALGNTNNQVLESFTVGYRFDMLTELEGRDYTQAAVTGIVYNILFKYGVEKLLPILKQCVAKVLEKQSRPSGQPYSLSLADPLSQQSLTGTSSRGKRPAEDVTQSLDSITRQRLEITAIS